MTQDTQLKYLEFFEDFLVTAVHLHQVSPYRQLPVERVFKALDGKYPEGWGERIVEDLVSKGFAHQVLTLTENHVALSWDGFQEAYRIEDRRRTSLIIRKIESERYQRIVSIANFAVAVFALIIALIALVK